MARPLRIQYPGAFYHVTCRGNERKKIFLNNEDRCRFLALLAESLGTYQVTLYAYILMDNHFHLLLQTMRANLSEFMRRFNICYTGWFNYQHGRCGHLYHGRYKAFLVDANNYLLEVSRYLHLNCVRVRSMRSANYHERWKYLMNYKWSSLSGYIGNKKADKLADCDVVLSMVGGRRSYQLFIIDGLKKELKNPFKNVKGRVILGNEDFVRRVKSKYIKYGSLRDQPSYKSLISQVIEPEIVVKYTSDVFGIDNEQLKQRYGDSIIRGILCELLYRYSDMNHREIGVLLGDLDYSAVNKLRSRLKTRMIKNKDVLDQYTKVERKIKKYLSKVES